MNLSTIDPKHIISALLISAGIPRVLTKRSSGMTLSETFNEAAARETPTQKAALELANFIGTEILAKTTNHDQAKRSAKMIEALGSVALTQDIDKAMLKITLAGEVGRAGIRSVLGSNELVEPDKTGLSEGARDLLSVASKSEFFSKTALQGLYLKSGFGPTMH